MNPAQDPSAVGTWLLVAFAVSSGVGTLLSIVAFFRPRPANHEVYATKDALEKLEARHVSEAAHLHKRISDLRSDVSADGEKRAATLMAELRELRIAVTEQVGGIHNRITDTQRSVARLEGTLAATDKPKR